MTLLTRAQAAAIAAIVTGLVVSGCGGESSSATADTADIPAKMTTIKVGIQPVSSQAYLRLGEKQGFFEKRNLKIEYVDIATSDVGVTSLISNALNFATVNPPVEATATHKKLPVRWVFAGVTSPSAPDPGNAGIFVKPDGDIRTWADLSGKRVQVPCIKCISDLWVRLAVDANGGDSSAIKFVVLPTADAPGALAQGNVDAIGAFSALIPIVKSKGYRLIGDQILATAPSQPIIPFSVNTQWADDHQAVVRAFVAAAGESATYADAHMNEWQALLPTYYHEQVPDQAAAQKVKGHWQDCFSRAAIQTLIDGMNKYGWVDNVTLDDLFYKGIGTKFC